MGSEEQTRILFVSHTGLVGGAERSLCELIREFPDRRSLTLATPSGPLVAMAESAGARVVEIPRLERGFGGGPVAAAAASAELVRAGIAISRAARTASATSVHANSSRAGLMALAARGIGGPPAVVYLRDELPGSSAGKGVAKLLGRADRVVANSRHTAAGFPAATRHPIIVEYPPVSPPGKGGVTGMDWRRQNGVPDNAFAVGIVGQITPWKGHDVAVEAVRRIRQDGIDAHLAIIGEVKFRGPSRRHDNEVFARRIRRACQGPALSGHVSFTGESDRIGAVMDALDVLVVPSWSEPFGRVIIEAGISATPAIVTSEGGATEAVSDGVNGLIRHPRAVSTWAGALADLAQDQELRHALGTKARDLARRYDPAAHAQRIKALHRGVSERPD